MWRSICTSVRTSQKPPGGCKDEERTEDYLGGHGQPDSCGSCMRTPPHTPQQYRCNTRADSRAVHFRQNRRGSKDLVYLTIGPSHTMSNKGNQLQESSQRSMTFQIDKNTTVDGKLQVGANADVTYREEEGKFVAINVRVS